SEWSMRCGRASPISISCFTCTIRAAWGSPMPMPGSKWAFAATTPRSPAAAGNVCTEDLVFMCHEMGIETGIDLEALIACANLAEDVVGHPLPGSVMKGGSLGRLREKVRAA